MHLSGSNCFRSLLLPALLALLPAVGHAQYTYGKYLEPPEGTILQGIGHWDDGNAAYLSALGGYSPAPWPAHEHLYANIPSEAVSNGNNNHPLNANWAKIFREQLRELADDTSGHRRIPEISITFRNWGDGGATHDDELFDDEGTPPYSNTFMEDQITLLGEVLADYSIADAPYSESPGTVPGLPVFVSIGQEFNNADAYHEWAFPEAWHRTKQLLAAAGATQVSYIWCWEAAADLPFGYNGLTGKFAWYPGNHPGDEPDWWGVDVFGQEDFMDGFPSDHFDNVEYFLDVADYAEVPVFICEASCVEFEIDGGVGGTGDVNDSWGEWFEPFLDFVANHPGIKAIAYLSHDWTQGGGWFTWEDGTITNSTLVMDNWVDAMDSAPYAGSGAAVLESLQGYLGWYDLGHAKGGHSSMPRIAGSGKVMAGASLDIELTDAFPSAPSTDAFLIVGADAIYTSYQGGVLVPDTDVVIPFATSGTGTWSFPFTWPSPIADGVTFYYQVWINNSYVSRGSGSTGWTASNALAAKTLIY